ncbi:MAG: biotin transporter BioY [Firmicutes bacterium HGW-Firmicutes-13]|nr:MAG: biotin transporter BioY [Firmicutes bacterium HGW-Firmicutes-13]
MNFTARDITYTAVFTAAACITGLLLKIAPASVVPFSFLPLIAMLAGGLLGSRLGALSMSLYMILGLAGIPVFSAPPFGGLAYVFQPTFGFIIGFIFCAYVVGKILERNSDSSYIRYAAAMIAGLCALYTVGLSYLYVILHLYLGKTLGFMDLLVIGFLPFILFDFAKALIAVSITRTVIKRLKTSPLGNYRRISGNSQDDGLY